MHGISTVLSISRLSPKLVMLIENIHVNTCHMSCMSDRYHHQEQHIKHTLHTVVHIYMKDTAPSEEFSFQRLLVIKSKIVIESVQVIAYHQWICIVSPREGLSVQRLVIADSLQQESRRYGESLGKCVTEVRSQCKTVYIFATKVWLRYGNCCNLSGLWRNAKIVFPTEHRKLSYLQKNALCLWYQPQAMSSKRSLLHYCPTLLSSNHHCWLWVAQTRV